MGPTVITLPELRDLMRSDGPWILWLGSAVSFALPSAMPGVSPVITGLLSHLLSAGSVAGASHGRAAAAAVDALLRGEVAEAFEAMPFEAKMGELEDHLPTFVRAFLEHAYVGDRPNDTHRAAIDLLGDLVDCVITTNFDTCLESALAEDAEKSRSVAVVTPVTGRFDVSPPAIVKVHGSIEAPDTLAATVGGLTTRANDSDWLESLLGMVAARWILAVGYSWSDSFDINPVVRRAVAVGTRIVQGTASGRPPRTSTLAPPVEHLIVLDLSEPERNILMGLSGRSATRAAYEPDDPVRRVAAAVESASRQHPVSPAQAIRAIAALHHWLDSTTMAVRLFEIAQEIDPRPEDDLVATALVHARRYRAALRRLERLLLAAEQPRVEDARRHQVIHWLCAAGHVAAAGGRVREGARFYARAGVEIRGAGLQPADLPPALADLYLRGRAENELHLAEICVRPSKRRLHVTAAARLRDELARVPDTALKTQVLHRLLDARLELADGRRDRSAAILRSCLDEAARWSDPHLEVVIRRLLVRVDGSGRTELMALAHRARHDGRGLEALKIRADLLAGARIPSWARPVTRTVRDAFIELWDAVHDVVLAVQWQRSLRRWR